MTKRLSLFLLSILLVTVPIKADDSYQKYIPHAVGGIVVCGVIGYFIKKYEVTPNTVLAYAKKGIKHKFKAFLEWIKEDPNQTDSAHISEKPPFKKTATKEIYTCGFCLEELTHEEAPITIECPHESIHAHKMHTNCAIEYFRKYNTCIDCQQPVHPNFLHSFRQSKKATLPQERPSAELAGKSGATIENQNAPASHKKSCCDICFENYNNLDQRPTIIQCSSTYDDQGNGTSNALHMICEKCMYKKRASTHSHQCPFCNGEIYTFTILTS